MTRFKTLIPGILLLMLWGCGEQPLREYEKKPDAPELKVPLLSGGELLLEEWEGKPLVLNFWASWCPPCREEIPSMNRAYVSLKEQGVRMLAVNIGESEAKVRGFLAHTNIDFPVALDPTQEHTRKWPVVALPMTYIIDGKGRVIYSAAGPREWDAPDLIEKITALRE